MVTDQELGNIVENLLRTSDPQTFTNLDSIVKHLEAKLGLDLSHKSNFIRNHIHYLFGHQQQPPPPPPQQHQQQQHPPPPPQPQLHHPPPPQPQVQPHLTARDHFALQSQYQQLRQHHPQFLHQQQLQQQHSHQIASHFALQHQQQQQQHQQQQQQQQRHHEELNFHAPPTQQQIPNLHLQTHPNPLPIQPQPQPQPQARSHPKKTKAEPKEGAPAKRRGGPGGLNKVCGVSPELQTIVGEPTMPRTEIVKQLWAYIRKHKLQDPSNKRKIICNDELRLVFETDCTDMFKMNKLLSKHIIALEPSKESGREKKRAKVEAESASESTEPSSPSSHVNLNEILYSLNYDEESGEEKKPVKAEEESASESGVPLSPSLVIISDALAKFFGSGDREIPQSEALRRVWEYIQENHLEDPTDSLMILCDQKLQELFGCETLPALGVTEMVGHHLFKRS
ncbi:hypothetical protein MKW94_013602 [Papaver nudicaule]|uniref:DM2 domain-containing protein n=1 Tax=Papaver nudicaule TaxID=74823 RepID=A0AA41SMF9_PAPNU|nr:hypothetical protein [Papaver nudicaule]